jgi:hypothetical protein
MATDAIRQISAQVDKIRAKISKLGAESLAKFNALNDEFH